MPNFILSVVLFFAIMIFVPVFPALGDSDSSRPLWLRSPAVSPDGTQIAFSYGGQIWRVASEGGDAVPLTSSLFYESSPVWSPDGQWIAFASNRHGNEDVFVTPAAGGEIRRLSYHSSEDHPYSFSADGGSVYFYSTRLGDAAQVRGGQVLGLDGQLWSVPVGGGRERLEIAVPALNVRSESRRQICALREPSRRRERMAQTRDFDGHAGYLDIRHGRRQSPAGHDIPGRGPQCGLGRRWFADPLPERALRLV